MSGQQQLSLLPRDTKAIRIRITQKREAMAGYVQGFG
jgi:hypothetical protein